MQRKQNIMMYRRIVDVCMTVLLLFLMAYQVTGEALHEWIGMGMTLIVIIHQILNRRWYAAIFKGRYNPYRILTTAVNVLLVISFLLTAICGMSMSGHAVPFLYGILKVSFSRKMHLSMSHWSFVLMGLHLGLHIPVITAKWKLDEKKKMLLSGVFCVIAGIGLYLFIKSGMTDYLFFRVPFAFLDYEKAAALVLFENILMLLFWAFAGTQGAVLCRNANGKDTDKHNKLLPVVFLMAAVILGLALSVAFSLKDAQESGGADWSAGQETKEESTDPSGSASAEQADPSTSAEQEAGTEESDTSQNIPAGQNPSAGQNPEEVRDGFVLIEGGTYQMGSPETENLRIDDETQHEVTISSLYADPFETTQKEYERLMGSKPSTFSGEDLPVENISWLEAIEFANAKSSDAGLTPAYILTAEGVSWDQSADGYRLPTEAEWEYICRAGTTTPFNTEKSLDASEANFYGHYPYEIEENYFDSSDLEAKPGEYRQTTVAVGSFEPNGWGLYDCHGNVNEWCWDYYGAYAAESQCDPTGPETGTRHIYRGGGWNDFAKNMRSAYRAAGQADMRSYNLGLRLVRNAGGDRSGTVTAKEAGSDTAAGGKILIAYFSWSGNTRGIAQEIQRQTGADIFEITPVKPYSSDYNTVLMEAQEDQHRQARPELSGHVENFDEYDIVLLGYPNWWASIPMPIASFLEEYDFSGKTIIPFCSHGGGRFGQSLTAIAKLAPDSDLGEGLSVHYSGGTSLPDDISAWLDQNGIGR